MSTTTLAPSDQVCDVCKKPRRCLLVVIDEEGYAPLTTAICPPCINAAMTPRHFGRSRWDVPEGGA